MPFAKGAKATPTYFRARSGALGLAMFQIPDEIIRTLADRRFKQGANSPLIWGLAANRLLVAADLLYAPIKEAQDRERKRAFESIHEKDGARELTDEEQADMFQSGTISVWAMLIALAFENLLKGVIVAGQTQPRLDGKLPTSGHDLIYLAKKAGLELSELDRKQLLALTEYSVWKGRYYLPENSNELYEIERRTNGRTGPPIFHDIEQSAEALRTLRERLVKSYETSRAGQCGR